MQWRRHLQLRVFLGTPWPEKKWENKKYSLYKFLSHVVATPEIFYRVVIKKLKLYKI